MQPIRLLVGKILGTDLPVLIQGENGTGKGLLAQYIHSRSVFASGSFVKVNCAAIPSLLLESELFGHEQGAYTDAHTSKAGYVEMAERGTLFLDEIADLDSSLQAKILQLLQDGQFSRIGDTRERHANTRVICATNRNLEREIASGHFRQDLFYRINVITIHLPPLRERREDVVALATYFLGQLNARFERNAPPFPKEVLETFARKEWRGNIRELENLVARYAIMGSLEAVNPEANLKRFSMPADQARRGWRDLPEAHCQTSHPRDGKQPDPESTAGEQMEPAQSRRSLEYQLPGAHLQNSGSRACRKETAAKAIVPGMNHRRVLHRYLSNQTVTPTSEPPSFGRPQASN